MPVIPYDDHKVSLRRPHGNGHLDIVRASNTRRKANVTEALHRVDIPHFENKRLEQVSPRTVCIILVQKFYFCYLKF